MSSITYIALIITTLFLAPPAFSTEPHQSSQDAQKMTPFIPGTDKPKARKCGTGNIYQYNTYTIYTVPTESEVGESVFVYPTNKRNPRLCSTKNQKPILLFDNVSHGGANYFAGLSEDYIFIDQGTGPSFRGLSIYDLKDGKLVFFTNYTDPFLSDGTLRYFETISAREYYDLKNKCPERGSWKRQGLIPLYQREMKYNIESGKEEPLDNYRCAPGQY